MAGIGFELKKIYRENSISRTFVGGLYSTLITVGPTIIVMGTIIFFNIFLGYLDLPYTERELLSSTLLYCFIFPSITTSMTGAVLARYIADKFYFEKYEDIMPSYYIGLMFNIIIGSAISIPFVIRLILVGNVDIIFSIVSYVLFFSVIISFYSMTYLHSTKDYKIIAIDFLTGMLVGIVFIYIFKNLFMLPLYKAILYGFTIGFFLISTLLFAYIKKYYRVTSNNFSESLKYLYRFFPLVIANLFYFSGLFVHNFVFWTTPMQLVVADTYYSMQPYDMATCLALFTNISTIIIFTVMAETNFHEKYKKYMESVIGSTYRDIQRSKESMFRTIIQQINHVFAIQIIITAILFLVAMIFLPRLGFGGMTMEIYPALVIGFLLIFLMYCNIVFLYYFDDNRGAMYTSILFFATTLIMTYIATGFPVQLYGIGVVVGAALGWTFSFFRIRYVEKHFEKHIFCNIKLMEQKSEEIKPLIIYDRNKNNISAEMR